jgi:hypothetical protein
MNYRKSIRFTIFGGLLSLTVLSLSIQSFAQCKVLGIGVRVNVTDRQGKEIADLTKDDFIIYEDGVKQILDFWKRNAGPDRQADQPMYEVGYLPNTRHFRGEWRKIRIVVRNQDERKLKVEFTPKGYYAKKEIIP